MKASAAIRRSVRFGPFEVDLCSGELRKEGVKIKLQEQPLRLLALLLECPGQVVSRDELRQKLWPADTFVGFDDGLNTAVKKLRDALGDSSEKPLFIETLPKRGYRFISTVTSLNPSPSSEGSPAGPTRLKRWSRSRIVLLPIGVVTVLLAAYLVHRPVRSELGLSSGRIMLAVLPFENLSGDPQQEFFIDGLTEEMITELGGLEPAKLGVIARTSAMQYKHGNKAIDQIGRDLGVQYVVEGGVQKAGDRVRISAQLIQVVDQTHLWAQMYDRNISDILAIQADVARAIAEQIKLKVSPERLRELARPSSVDGDAFELYLNGRYTFNQPNLGQAVDYFQRAIQKDPDYALAYSGLADSYTQQASWGMEAPVQVLEKARPLAEKALALNGSLAEAHTSLAYIRLFSWDFAGAEQEFKRALDLDPSYANAHHWYSHLLVAQGRMDESLAETRRGLLFDPLDPSLQVHEGWHNYYARHYDRAIASVDKSLANVRRSVRPLPHSILGLVYEQERQYDTAIAEFGEAIRDSGRLPVYIAQLAHAQAVSGNTAEALRIVEELNRLPKQKYVPPEEIAAIYVALGENETAFRWLQTAYDTHSASLINLNVDPRFDTLRADPRFSELVRRIGLPQ